MALAAGTRFGAYEITGQLGVGGMGEVYRATDTKLGRDVAIKTLPAALVSDKDRLARFEREARLLAALNHAHIASVYNLDEHEGTLYLAMELVEGETLEEKLKGGALPVEETLRIALQIAGALEAAHDRGVIHRDLKPANIMLTRDGQVKVLDFGLAKAFAGNPSEASPVHSPALSLAMTQAGIVLGTASYMSPEQASGQATDQRADVWAFGVVLYEMLTGLPLYSGESVPHILAAVLQLEPDWNRLPKNLHPRLRQLLERCLEKKPRNRYHGIADARVDLEAALRDPEGVTAQGSGASAGVAAPAPLPRRLLPWAAGLVLATLAATAAWTLRTPAPGPVIRFVHQVPDARSFMFQALGAIAISPDGRQFVYNATDGLYLRQMDTFEEVSVAGTEEVRATPVFSPDGHSLAYFRPATTRGDVALVRHLVTGGAIVPLGVIGNTGNNLPYGLRWEPDGTLVYSLADGVWRISENGGEPERIVETEPGERAAWPELLPGGDWVLFSLARGTPPDWDTAEIVVESLASGERRVLRAGGRAARYAQSGHLIYAFGDTLYAAPFDLDALEITGGPVPVVQGVAGSPVTGVADYAFSRDGTLIYLTGAGFAANASRLAIVDRNGRAEAFPMEAGTYADARVSPDGRWAAYTVTYADGQDIAVYELGGAVAPRRLTFGGTSRFPLWSADGARVAFQSTRDGTPSLYWQTADGSGSAPAKLTEAADGEAHVLDSFSSDGGRLAYSVEGPEGSAIRILDLRSNEQETLLSDPGVTYSHSVFSPDGRWIAYQSTETGEVEIFVQPYPPTGAKYQLPHTFANHHPAWSPDGTELFYFPGPGRFESVRVTTEPGFSFGTAVALTNVPMNAAPATRRQLEVMPDGSGFLGVAAASAVGPNAARHIRIVQNWFEDLKRLAPTQ